MTINEIRTKIADLKKEYNRKLSELQPNSTIVTIRELNGTEIILSSEFDFHSTLDEVRKMAEEIAALSAKLTAANTQLAIMGSKYTIQEGITRLQELRNLMSKIDYIITFSREKRVRKAEGGYGSASSPYYEITSLNFDKDKLEAIRKELLSEINAIEIAIDKVNTLDVII